MACIMTDNIATAVIHDEHRTDRILEQQIIG